MLFRSDLGHPLRTGSSFASRKYPFWVTLGEGVIDVPIKDDRPGSLRTECFELQPGKAGARAARAVVDDLARDLGELYEDTRLLVSELVTAGAERLDENTAPRLELSIHKAWLKVELLYEGADADVISLNKSIVGEWTRMLLDALTSNWGISGRAGVCLWFELRRT